VTRVDTEREVLVRAMTWAADGVLSIVLVDPTGGELPAWEPGAHIDLQLPAPGGVMSRQYSLCGDPADRSRYLIGVLREQVGRGGSAFVHEVLRPGQVLRVRGPRNHFRLEPSPRYLFVAGGIGITPILPMIAAAQAAGARWQLVYGGRTAASMAFTEVLATYGDHVSLRPQEVHGLLDLAGLLQPPQPDTLVYTCGPEPLLAAVEKQCQTWPAGTLHLERFAAPEQPARDPADEHSVEVVLQASGRTVMVPPDRSVLEALNEAGADILSDCLEGICGTCETRVIEGQVDHRDFVLTEAERAGNQYMMPCVSRALSAKLVLDA
jgi:ferredoxin-NADP reductase